MYRRLFHLKGFILVWLLVVSSALSDAGAESFNSNFNRFRQKIPRIGRRGEGIIAEYMDSDSFPLEGSLSNFFLKASKAVPRLGRRKDISSEPGHAAALGIGSLSGHQEFNPLVNEVPIIGVMKQDTWPYFHEETTDSKKGLIIPKSQITSDSQENYIHDLVRSLWVGQKENSD